MRYFITSLLAAFILFGHSLSAQAAPSIVWTDPANNATGVDVAIGAIWAQFDDPKMDGNSFVGRVSVDNGAVFTVSKVNDWWGDYLKITLTGNLKYSTTYTVTVDYRVKNNSGTQMGVDYVWKFTTMAKPIIDTTPPTVLSTSPVSGAVGVPLSSDVVITFDEVMGAASINTTNITLYAGATKITGTVSLDGTGKIATFHPSSALSSDTLYTATVTTGVKDAVGNALAGNYVWQFRTMMVDTVKPTVTSVSPLAGATGVDPATAITATFSEAMDPLTINSSSFTVGGVTGTVSYDAGTFTATFMPSASLAFSTNYTATVSTGAKDLAGNSLAASKVWTFTTVKAAVPPPLTDYCQIPPFVTGASGAIKPNVLLMVDNSGSMYEFAYKTPGKGQNDYDDSYNPASEYYGYFDTAKMYKYDGNNFLVDDSLALDKTVFKSGNFLNWLTMRRVDVIRKVLVGGKTQPRSANTANYLIPTESPDRDTMKTYNNVKYRVRKGTSTEEIYDETNNATYKLKIYVGNQPPQEGLVLRYSDRIRFGIMLYNDGYQFESKSNVRDGGEVAADIGNTGTDLITKIEGADPSTWTPLAETLYEATRYFQATTSAYNGGTYSGKDPIEYSCQKDFVLILTDGESTKDRNLPGGYWTGNNKVTDANFNVQTWMDSIATQEGTSSQYSVDANTDQGTYYLEGVAYYAHNTDFRSATLGKSNLAGKQNITTYAVFAFDDSAVGRDLLKKTAKYGGFDDFDGSGKPDKVGKWDKDGDGLPDTYFEPKNGSQLEQSLLRAFNDILARISSGTASSILSNSEGSGANLLQAVFYPKKYFEGSTEATWIGEIQNFWYHLDPFLNNSTVREDTNSDKKLELNQDKIVRFYFDTSLNQTLVRSWDDADGNGVADTGTDTVKMPDDVKSLWKAGQLLWERSGATRTVFAGDPSQSTATKIAFNTDDDTGGIHTKSNWWTYLQVANKVEAKKVIDYVNGTDQAGYRSRKVQIGANTYEWKLGDIVSSTPKFQPNTRLNTYDRDPPAGYADASYADYLSSTDYKSRGMVYVGANDGMLHAFKLGLLDVSKQTKLTKAELKGTDVGKEEWAFIPRNVLPYLKYLADPLYNHIFYVDNTVTLYDVSINPVASNATKFPNCQAATSGDSGYWNCEKITKFKTSTTELDTDKTSWRTVLIGGMGLGGASREPGSSCDPATECVRAPVDGLGYSSYFALDVTDPSNPKYLWEFAGDLSNTDVSKRDYLGYATSGPSVVRVGSSKTNGRWFAVFGSGPTGPIDTAHQQFLGRSTQNLKLFIVDLADGTLVKTIDTGLANAFASSMSNSMIDTERGLASAPGHYQDNVIYIGYTQKDDAAGTWTKGGVIRLVTNESVRPDSADSGKKWTASVVIDGIGPVTSAVTKLQDRRNMNLWLYFGTGRYFFKTDDADTSRAIYGILEPCYTSANTIDASCTTERLTSELKNQTTSPSLTLSSEKGWYINLDPYNTSFSSERVITDPVAAPNGVIYFTSFMPTSDVCGFGGNSYIWAVDYNNGAQPPANTMIGKALLQVSTGAFEEVNLSTAFTDKSNRRTENPITGVPPKAQGLALTLPPRPMHKILQIQEK
jgi:type IV pilus assembly protein PilY1